jgi:hypothetical protein
MVMSFPRVFAAMPNLKDTLINVLFAPADASERAESAYLIKMGKTDKAALRQALEDYDPPRSYFAEDDDGSALEDDSDSSDVDDDDLEQSTDDSSSVATHT